MHAGDAARPQLHTFTIYDLYGTKIDLLQERRTRLRMIPQRCSGIRAERTQNWITTSLGKSLNAPESVLLRLQSHEQQRVNPPWPKETNRFLDNFQEDLLADPQFARHDL